MKYLIITLIVDTTNTHISSFDLLEKVSDFYNSAWDKLILIGSISIGIVGILVPLLIQHYQKIVLQVHEDRIKEELKLEFKIAEEQLRETLNSNLEEKFKEFEERLKKLSASAKASTLHLQGNTLRNDSLYNKALVSFIKAALLYQDCDENTNLQTMLTLVNEEVITKLKKRDIEDLKISHELNLEESLNKLESNDKPGILKAVLRSIRLKLNRLK